MPQQVALEILELDVVNRHGTVLSTFRGVASPEGRVGALREELDRVRSIRLPLYQNDERIGQVFEQRRSNVTEVLAGGGLTLETSGGVLSFVTGKASKTRSASETIQVTPLLQALLLEEAEQERGSLIDLAVGKPKPGSLLYFVGPGRIFRPDQEVEEIAHPELLVRLQDAQAIQATREEQELVMSRSARANRKRRYGSVAAPCCSPPSPACAGSNPGISGPT